MAMLETLKEGDLVQLVGGFSCTKQSLVRLYADKHGKLYFRCNEGRHYLDGQLNLDGTLAGICRNKAETP
jgi:hypothetical protein